MKTLITIALTLLMSFAYAQTDTILDCAKSANKKGMVYLKNFQVILVPNSAELSKKWPVVLNKGTKYRFYLCEKDDERPSIVELVLFDKAHPESSPYGTTKKKGHFYFECNKTGTYHVAIRYKADAVKKEISAVGIMLFVSKNE